jgi:hypothetical protein
MGTCEPPSFTLDKDGSPNPLCVGGGYGRTRALNISADLTIDEFYLWGLKDRERYWGSDISIIRTNTRQKLEEVKDFLWRRGRYYKKGDATFESGIIDLRKLFTPRRSLGGSSEKTYPDTDAMDLGENTLILGVT